MDQERTFLVVAVGVAVAVGVFVLWGPSSFRSKKRKGRIIGLLNLGHTCFLNTLLQALASCPTVIDWLLQHTPEDKGSLISALHYVLSVLNGEHSESVSDPYAPTEVINALIRHDWIISPGEQDAHELFHVLLETLEEEVTSLCTMNGSLSDILLPERCGQGDNSVVAVSILKRSLQNGTIKCDGDQHSSEPASRLQPMRRSRYQGSESKSYSSTSVESSPILIQTNPPPFRGTLTSQLKCTQCGFKSPIKFDKFDTLSLPLPSSGKRQRLTLQTLLDNFINTEIVRDVTCSNCSKGHENPVQTTALKTLNFGKLPKCLCMHIVRTTWNKDGLPCKREDFVDFPEFLIMDNYTHSQVQQNARKSSKTLEKVAETNEISFVMQTNECKVISGVNQQLNIPASKARHMYRLKAVVVHSGDLNSGHFITYRKGPVQSHIRHRLLNLEPKMELHESRESARWFFTNDMMVRRASLCDALLSNAYMLFYEKSVIPASQHAT